MAGDGSVLCYLCVYGESRWDGGRRDALLVLRITAGVHMKGSKVRCDGRCDGRVLDNCVKWGNTCFFRWSLGVMGFLMISGKYPYSTGHGGIPDKLAMDRSEADRHIM